MDGQTYKAQEEIFGAPQAGAPSSEHPGQRAEIIVVGSDLAAAVDEAFQVLQPDDQGRLSYQFTVCQNPGSELIPILMRNQDEHVISIVVGADLSAPKVCFDALQFAERPFLPAVIQSYSGASSIDRVFADLQKPWCQGLHLLGLQGQLSDLDFYVKSQLRGTRILRLGQLKNEL